MSLFYTQKITSEIQDAANVGLAAFAVSAGDKRELAAYYGVSLRTVERWFADPSKQRLNCMPNAAVGHRLYNMFGTERLDMMRIRCLLPVCLGLDGGLEREPTFGGALESFTIGEPTLAACVIDVDLILTGRWAKSPFIRKAWVQIIINPYGVEPDDGGAPLPWAVTVDYRTIRPPGEEGPGEEPDDIYAQEDASEFDEDGQDDYDEYDDENAVYWWDDDPNPVTTPEPFDV